MTAQTTTTATRGMMLELLRGSYLTDRNQLRDVTKVTLIGIRYADAANPLTGWAPIAPLPKMAQMWEPAADAPGVVLVQRKVMGQTLYHLEPADPPDGRQTRPHYMAGGTFATMGDSRVAQLVNFYGALSVHDYHES
jgi:hypothetical protein